jgi:DNA-binding FadR family transcriptional regulator
LVEVRPRLGTNRRDYSFAPAVRQSLGYALALNNEHFRYYSDLRNHVESAFWYEAARKLTEDDKCELRNLIDQAFAKLRGSPIRVPHEEHRNLHLLIYSRLENPFVTGILEAYWDAYENVGLNVYTGGIDYLEEVWNYHKKMVDAICSGNFEDGYNALIAHTDLLYHRP